LSMTSMARVEPALFDAIATILAEHPREKGLIHAPSYAAGRRLVADLTGRGPAFSRRLIWVESAQAKTRSLDQHRAAAAPTVLVSPSLREGVDLPDDFLRFQVVTKMPYPDLGDPWTAARRSRDPRWYALETAKALVQAYGRSCRHADDHGITYVLDGQFERFLTHYRPLLPIDDLARWRDPQTAERERDTRRDGEAHVGRRVERLRPVGLRRRDPTRGLAVLDRGVVRGGLHGRVVGADRGHETVDVDLELARDPLQRHVLRLRHLADPVFLAEEVDHFLVEDLKRGAARLADERAPVLHI